MERIRLCGLPDCCAVGPATLVPRSNEDGLLQPCRVCTKVSVKYHLCASGHSLCPDCIPPSDTRKKWCVICEAHVDFTEEIIQPRIIEAMEFSCACLFTSSLPRISEHLRNTTTPHLCYGQPRAGAQGEPSHRPRRFQEALDRLNHEHERVRISLSRQDSYISELTESLCKLRTICDVLCGARRILCFSFETILRGQLSEGHTIVDGVPLRIQVSRIDHPMTCYLCVSVAGSDIDGETSPWPLRKRIRIRILDSHGSNLATPHNIFTYENGNYTHPSFVEPAAEPSTGVSFFVPLGELHKCYLRQGSEVLVISVTVHEISTE